jgi:hypothetical protein
LEGSARAHRGPACQLPANLDGCKRAQGPRDVQRELGSLDRRVLCALSESAVRTKRRESGYALRSGELANYLGLSRRNKKNYEDLAGALWRLSRTVVHLNAHDELSGSWGTKGFMLLPELVAARVGREWELKYDFPQGANDLIERGALCTVDTHRLSSLKSPAAESLYCLLFDVAQWSRLPSIAYPIADLAQRLGLGVPTTTSGRRVYQDWSKPLRTIRTAAERTYSVGQIITDYCIAGKSADAVVTFFFARGRSRKRHLPPAAGVAGDQPHFDK